MREWLPLLTDNAFAGGMNNFILYLVIRFLLLALLSLALVVGLTSSPLWVRFAEKSKKRARFLLFLLVALLMVPQAYISDLIIEKAPVRLMMEEPAMTSLAIKMGLYNLYFGNVLEGTLTPPEQKLSSCIWTLARQATETQLSLCEDAITCLQKRPVWTRQDIVETIKKSQHEDMGLTSKACASVDTALLDGTKRP